MLNYADRNDLDWQMLYINQLKSMGSKKEAKPKH